MLQLRTFGTLDLRQARGAEIRAVLAQPKRVALLAYLAIATPRGFHRRDRLLALFWPELDTEHARAALSRAIYFLRRELGEGVIISRGDEIGVDRDRFWCDAAVFEDMLESGEVRQALELYAGELLPGFFASHAGGFEDWLERERARLQERAADGAWALADEAEQDGNFALAAHWARRGVELAPFRELGIRRLLALLDRSGDRAGAAQTYKKFADDLAAELELAPSPETRALIDAIRERQSQRATGDFVAPQYTNTSTTRSATPGVAAPPTMAPPSAPPVSRSHPFRHVNRWILAAAMPMVGFAAIIALLGWRGGVDATRIDVVAFENRTGDQRFDHLGRLTAERIASSLRQASSFKTVTVAEPNGWFSRQRIAAAGLAASAAFSHKRAVIVVSGTILRRDDTLVFQARIADARRGDSVWSIAPIARAIASPDSAIDQVRQRVLGGVAAIRNPSAARFFPVASLPPTFEAYEEYVEGMRFAARGQAREALGHFRWANALDTSFTWPLVEAASPSLLMPATADSLIATLKGMRGRLPQLQQHLLDYLLATRADDWQGGYRALREASRLAPGSYGYQHAVAASHVNKPGETVEILSAHGLDTLLRNNTNYWYVLTLALHQLGDYRRELEAARRARQYRPTSARALSHEIRALAALGRVDAVHTRLDTMLLLPRENWFIPPFAMLEAGLELHVHGQHDASTLLLRRAEAWFRARPATEAATSINRTELAEVLYALGEYDEAERLYRRLAREDTADLGFVARLGAIAVRRGRRAEAESIAARLKARRHFVPLPGDDATLGRAKIAALLGDRGRAVDLLIECFGAAGTAQLHQDIDFDALRDDPRFREFVRPKG